MRGFLIALIVVVFCAAESQAACRLRTRLQQRPAVSKVLNVTRSVTVGGCANGNCQRPATPALLPPAIPKK